MDELEAELLKTLSHFEPMTMDKIFLDLSRDFVEVNREITYEDLQNALESLVAQKKVVCKDEGEHRSWIKPFPKRKSPWRRILKNWFGL